MTEYSTGSLETGLHGQYELPVKSVLSQAWGNVHGTKASFVSGQLITVFFTMLVLLAITLICLALERVIPGFDGVTQLITSLVAGGWSVCSFAYLMRIAFNRLIGKPVNAKGYFKHFNYYGQGVALYLLQFVAIFVLGVIFIGLMLLVSYFVLGKDVGYDVKHLSGGSDAALLIPGIILLICAFFLYTFFASLLMLVIPVAIDRNIRVMLALRIVFTTLMKKWCSIIKINVVLTLILIASAIPLGLGLIWTMPLYFNSLAVIYERALGIKTRL